MKKIIFFYSPIRLNKTASCLLLFPFLLAGIAQSAKAQDNPFDRLKRVAQTQDTVEAGVSKITITQSSPFWKANSKQPVAFKPFELKDKNGRAIDPNEMVTLKNGKKVTAKQAIDQLNDIERKLNAQGFSLRNPQTSNASSTVTSRQDLDGRLSAAPAPVGILKTSDEQKKILSPTKAIGNVLLKPYSQYSSSEKTNLRNFSFNEKDGELKVQKLARPIPAIKAVSVNGVLKTINETSSRDWSFGSSSTIKAGIHGDLTRYAKIYSFDPQNPNRSKSEFKITARAKIYGDLFSHHLDLLNASATFFAPEDTTKQMTVGTVVSVAGITVYNFNRGFPQSQNLSGSVGRNINQSADFEVTVVWPIVVSGRIGVRGRIGLEYNANLYRTFVSATAKPVGELSGYAEAGVSIGGILGVGAGGNLIFVKGQLDMNAFAGVWIQNASQIVAAVSYYFGYDLQILKGNLYAYAEACVPDWVPFVGGSCSRYTHSLFNWAGYSSSGTIAEGTRTYVISNM